eukprot:TRINITY_DN5949_c2_g1_i1.p1 TRINITY_DN5949_c2_g1~~TRINITY_DN5949_c2_g1_i1.p1  ORF type:complete len:371 (+),score=73.18 TRINITY_DN5949_c2_g1_i1:41-1153(+)
MAERKAQIAVIGGGWWSQGWHLPHLHRNPKSDITAIVEPNPAPRSTLNPDMKTTKELEEIYSVPVFATIDEFLESDAAKKTEGVIICTSHASHAEIGLKCMKAGLHILMEKPMTTDVKEAIDLAKAAAQNNKIFMVNNTANFRENAKTAHELVKAGEVGEVKHVQCYMGSALLWLFENPENVGWVKPAGNMLGNGFAWGQLSHTLAWVYLVTGLTPKSVFCQMVYSDKTGADLFDTAVIKCTNGATISVEGTAAIPFKSYTESSKQIDNKIFGSEGMLMYSGDDYNPDSGSLVLKRHDLREQTFPGFYFENYGQEGDGPESVKFFLDGCLGKSFFNGADVHVGLKAVQTIDAMYRSANSGNDETIVEIDN